MIFIQKWRSSTFLIFLPIGFTTGVRFCLLTIVQRKVDFTICSPIKCTRTFAFVVFNNGFVNLFHSHFLSPCRLCVSNLLFIINSLHPSFVCFHSSKPPSVFLTIKLSSLSFFHSNPWPPSSPPLPVLTCLLQIRCVCMRVSVFLYFFPSVHVYSHVHARFSFFCPTKLVHHRHLPALLHFLV